MYIFFVTFNTFRNSFIIVVDNRNMVLAGNGVSHAELVSLAEVVRMRPPTTTVPLVLVSLLSYFLLYCKPQNILNAKS